MRRVAGKRIIRRGLLKIFSRAGATVGTTGPTAGAAFSFSELASGALDVFFARFGFLDVSDPANPLVARKRSDVCPRGFGFGCGRDGLAKVGGQRMKRAGGFGRATHALKRIHRFWGELNPQTFRCSPVFITIFWFFIVKFRAPRPWSRIVQSYRSLLNLRDYLAINEMEGHGFDRAEARWLITGSFAWELSGPA